MKTKLFFILAFLLIAIPGFIYFNSKGINQPELPPVVQSPDVFLFGAMHSMIDDGNDYGNFNDIGLNSWHSYVGTDVGNYPGNSSRHTPKGFMLSNDRLMTPVEDYDQDLIPIIDNIYEKTQARLIWQRPKIEWLCYGQSSIYQAEIIDPGHDLWFYAFNDHEVGFPDYIDTSELAGPVAPGVVFCSQSFHSPGFAVKRVKANTEQCHRITGTDAGNHWMGDSECDWFVKPRVRADRDFITNPGNSETEIFKVYIIDQNNNNKISPVSILAKHFQKNYDPENLYNGGYLEEFYFDGANNPPRGVTFPGDLGNIWVYGARGTRANDVGHLYKADIQVYWYGNCDMWLDYVKVENDVASDLLSNNPLNPNWVRYNQWIQKEVDLIAEHIPEGASEPAVYKFYIELSEFNNLPCMAYVNDKLKYYSDQKIDLLTDLTNVTHCHVNWGKRNTVSNAEFLAEHYVNKVGLTQIFAESYPMTALYEQQQTFSRIPETLPTTSGDRVLAFGVSPSVYDTWLQDNLNHTPYILETTDTEPVRFMSRENQTCPSTWPWQDPGNFGYVMKTCNQISKISNVPFIFMPQSGQWYTPGEVRREPTNEEMDMMANVGASYGAKGLIYYWFPSTEGNDPICPTHSRGMLEYPNDALREHNYYNEVKLKWHVFRDIGLRMRAWEPYILSFDYDHFNSYTYHFQDEREDLLDVSYFYGLYTYKPGSTAPPCTEDFPTGQAAPTGLTGECKEDRYIQVATFEKSANDGSKYFMIVNRRCSPYRPDINENGGRRIIKAKFSNHNGLLGNYNNWTITNCADGSEVTRFALSNQEMVTLGDWFMPGEGRLFKLTPTIKSGGTLVADENIEGVNFTCEDTVFNNGHNITIGANTTIHFTDTSAIVMDSGSFTMGNSQVSGSQSITSDAVSGNIWRGYSFNNCEVRIYGAAFGGLANDTTYALNIIDCPVVDIRNSSFNTNASLKGGINAVYYSTSTIDNIYIGGNTFTSTGSTLPQVQVMSYAGITTPLIIENNTFNYGNTAILLSGVTGGAIKDNNITDFSIGINLLTSSVDIADNTIVSSLADAIGIFGASGSEIKMNNSGGERLGGANDISTTGNESNNMKVDNSYFLIDRGENIFNINEANAYHLSGFFNPFVSATTDATQNCFKFNTSPVDPPYNNVTWGDQGPTVSFTFSPYLTGCTPADCEAPIVLDLGDGIYDSICSGGIGSGGGEIGIIPLSGGVSEGRGGLLIPNSKNHIPLHGGVYAVGSVRRTPLEGGLILQTPKQMYDSLSILMRHRNYPQAKTRCNDILNTYPDSLQSIYAISKLFLATIGSDTTTNTAQQLKTYYEGLILNHPNNTALVTRANYFIQKCKVRLRDYNSALTGFSQIINQNPYSYEALVARWDYMAASLLIQGSGGGEPSIKNYELGITNNDQSDEFDKFDESGDDKSPFSKQERQDIRKSINTALENTGRSDERKMKILEESSSLGDVNASVELSQRKTIKEVAKTERPKTIIEHVRIVAGDIRKVFGVNTSGKDGKSGKIPLVFRLSQNYPNPFNPVTKINYDLPRDAKVNIVIYDILGREVKRLLNNEVKSAGSYIVDFNASNYASGVYFYRIEAEEPNGNKFVDSKKMVLLK